MAQSGSTLLYGLVLATCTEIAYVSGAGSATQTAMLRPEEVQFKIVQGGRPVEAAALWGDYDTGPYGRFVRMQPGYEGRIHAHPFDYHGITLQGIWVRTVDGVTKELPSGSYVLQAGGQFHKDACKGPEVCILFIHQDAKGSAYYPEGPNK